MVSSIETNNRIGRVTNKNYPLKCTFWHTVAGGADLAELVLLDSISSCGIVHSGRLCHLSRDRKSRQIDQQSTSSRFKNSFCQKAKMLFKKR